MIPEDYVLIDTYHLEDADLIKSMTCIEGVHTVQLVPSLMLQDKTAFDGEPHQA